MMDDRSLRSLGGWTRPFLSFCVSPPSSFVPRALIPPRLRFMSLPDLIVQRLALARAHEVDRDVLLFLEALIQLKELPRVVHILRIYLLDHIAVLEPDLFVDAARHDLAYPEARRLPVLQVRKRPRLGKELVHVLRVRSDLPLVNRPFSLGEFPHAACGARAGL